VAEEAAVILVAVVVAVVHPLGHQEMLVMQLQILAVALAELELVVHSTMH
jgi:hypothetical protein